VEFQEYAGKRLIGALGLPLLAGRHCVAPEDVWRAARDIGPCVIKAQVAAGKRGKAGGIRFAATPDEAVAAAEAILAMHIGGQPVRSVLVEARAEIARELYAAVISDPAAKGPLIILSGQGGMDIEEIAARDPASVRRVAVNIGRGLDPRALHTLTGGLLPEALTGELAAFVTALYAAWCRLDAELLEINPLALLKDGRLVALDCKLTIDDASLVRQSRATTLSPPRPMTEREARGLDHGLKYIELDGNVGVLANGAGLTMTTMDLVTHFGGRPANFLEIGGEAYTKAKPALELVLSKPGIRSLIVNFCGAFARTDVMADGVTHAWRELKPDIPVFFSIHGTGEEAARLIVRERLGLECFEFGEDAVRTAVEAAR
jgi:succinyl-CoA synthetase beta subunit